MKFTYTLSDVAQGQLEDIQEYIHTKFGSRVADEKIAKIFRTFALLCNDPYMGRSLDRNDQNLRIYHHAPNAIIYDVDGNVLEIVHITDARTNYIKRLFPDLD